MRTAVIDAQSHVANVIEADPDLQLPGYRLVPSDTASTGDAYDPATDTFKPPTPPAPPVPPIISDRQFAQALAKMGVITRDEALAFVKRGEVPATLQAVIDGIEDQDERFDVDMAVSGATSFERSNPSTLVLAGALKWSPGQMDDLWRSAAALP